jgi:hypothetical protein
MHLCAEHGHPRKGPSPFPATLALLLVVGFVPIAASAQPHPDDPEVLAIFHRGRAMMEVGRYADAVLSFQQVLSHRESAGALFNLGLGLRALDRCREAVAAFERAVRIDTDPNRRHSAEINLRELRDCAARLRLDVRGQPAEVRIDGQRVDWHSAATVFSVDPGEHTLDARREGYQPAQAQVSLRRGEERTATLDASARRLPAATPSGPDRQRMNGAIPAERGVHTRWWFWTVIGLVTAGATTAIIAATGGFDHTGPSPEGSWGSVTAALSWP